MAVHVMNWCVNKKKWRECVSCRAVRILVNYEGGPESLVSCGVVEAVN